MFDGYGEAAPTVGVVIEALLLNVTALEQLFSLMPTTPALLGAARSCRPSLLKSPTAM